MRFINRSCNLTKEQIDAAIDRIMDRDNYWVIDYLPRRCDDVVAVNTLEKYLLTKKNRKRHAKQLVNIFLKIFPYYDISIWFGETKYHSLKKFPEYLCGKDICLHQVERRLLKLLAKYETVSILIEPVNAVLSLSVYNSALYFIEDTDIDFFKNIVESEGLFLWNYKNV